MSQQSRTVAGMSEGVFLAMFLIPCALTYIVGWVSPLMGLATLGVGWIVLKGFMALLYVWMAVASFLRGTANGRQWAVALPIGAGVVDVLFPFLPFVPTVLNILALVLGLRSAKTTTGTPGATLGIWPFTIWIGIAALFVRDGFSDEYFLPFVTPASETAFQAFVRVVNYSDEAGVVQLTATDDRGREGESIRLQLAANAVQHFNSRDLEFGNPSKGLSGGIGSGSVIWSLMLETDLDIEVFAFLRNLYGNLIPVHDLATLSGDMHYLPTFNPGSNLQQQSKLRLINRESTGVDIEIHGMDDDGELFGPVTLELAARNAVTLTADELEAGSRLEATGSLGDGEGKWRLFVRSDEPIYVMTLLEDRLGYLVNLSASKVAPDILATTIDRLFGIRNVAKPSGGTLRTEVTSYTSSEADFTVDMFVADEAGSLVEVGMEDLSIDDFSDLEFEVIEIMEVDQSSLGPYSAVFLMDQSGSIVDSDPNDARLDAVKSFLNNLGVGDEVGMLAFATSGKIAEFPVTSYTDRNGDRFTSDPRGFDSVLELLGDQEDGGTPLYDAICFAVDYVVDYAANSNKAIVVFTDGEDTVSGATFDEAVQCANDSDIPVHAVGLSLATNLNVLTSIAARTEGYYSHAIDAEQTISYYGVLGGFLSGSSQFHRTSWRVNDRNGNRFGRDYWIRSWINVDVTETNRISLPFRLDFTGEPSAESGEISIAKRSGRSQERRAVADERPRPIAKGDLPKGEDGGPRQ